jgi:hypothetical protein
LTVPAALRGEQVGERGMFQLSCQSDKTQPYISTGPEREHDVCGRYHLLALSTARASPVFSCLPGINETGSTTNSCEQVFCY